MSKINRLIMAICMSVVVLAGAFVAIWFTLIAPSQMRSTQAATQFTGSTTLSSVISSSYSVSVTNPYTSTYSNAYKWVYTSGYIVPTNQNVASSYSAFAMTYTAGTATEVTISYKCSSESSCDYLIATVNGSTPSGWSNKSGSMSSYSTATFSVSTTSQVRIELTYRKDGSVDRDDDCVYINSIIIKKPSKTGSSTLTSVISSSYSVNVTNPYTGRYSSSYSWAYSSSNIFPTNQGITNSYASFAIDYSPNAASLVIVKDKPSSESSFDYLEVRAGGSVPTGWVSKDHSGEKTAYTTTVFCVASSSSVKLEFMYRKDGSQDKGDDCVYISSIQILSAPYTLTLNKQSGSGGTSTVNMASGYTLPNISIPSRTGYTFGGYYTSTNGGGTQYYNNSGVAQRTGTSSNTTLYAKWTQKTYTVTLNNQSATTAGTSSFTTTYGASLSNITVPTKTGYIFKGYYSSQNGGGTQYFSSSGSATRSWDYDGNRTLYAYWVSTKYKVIYDESGFVNKIGALEGGFENTGWTGGVYDTTHIRSGSYAYKITGTTSSAEVFAYTSKSIAIDSTTKDHIFYAQYWGYQETVTGNQSTQIYWPEEEPSFGGPELGPANQWNMYSYRVDRSSNALSGNKQIRIDFDNRSTANDFWIDDFLLIDLTEIFGAGNEPSKSWCDANIRTGISVQEIEMNTATKLATRTSSNTITGCLYKGWSSASRTSVESWPAVMYTDGQTVTDIAEPGETIVLYAVWQIGKFTVTFDNQSATTAGTASVEAIYGLAMPNITLPTRVGYDFGGYFSQTNGGGTQYYNADGSSAKNYDKVEGIKLYAKWTIKNYTLTLDSTGGKVSATTGWNLINNGASATKSIAYQTKVGSLPTPTKSGYTFVGWYLDLISMGYTPLQYIQSSTSGNECINTGYSWTHENIRIVCDAYAPSTGSAESLFGTEENVEASGSSRWFGGIPHGGNGRYSMYIGSTSQGTIEIGTGGRFVMELSTTTAKHFTVMINGVSKLSGNYSGSVMTSKARNQYDSSFVASGGYGKFYIFSNHNSNRSTTNYAGTQFAKGMTLYSFKMYDNDVLVRDYLPVKNGNGVAGLYDLVNQEFVTTNSGAFVAGPEMNEKALYTKTAITDQTDYTATQNMTVYAKWIPNNYVVTADAKGGTISTANGWAISSDKKTATKSIGYYSSYGTLPTPTRLGYTFNGWCLDLKKSGYTMLEYIESSSSGGEYINTNYYWHTENVRIVADIMAQSSGSAESLFGSEEYASSSADVRWFACVPHGGNGSYAMYMGNSYSTGSISISKTARSVLDITAIDGNSYITLINGEMVKGRTAFADSIRSAYAVTNYQASVQPSGSYGLIYLFANHNSNRSNSNYSSTQNAKSMRLYSFQMWDNDQLVRYYVPVKNSSGVAGLYDLVEDKFYTTPTGTFIAGPEGTFKLNENNIISNSSNYSIYADWTINTYTVTYNANGGSGTMKNSVHSYGVAKKLNKNNFVYAGYQFAGWATSSSSKNVEYTDEQNVLNMTTQSGVTINLYAIWKILYKITVQANIADAVGVISSGGIYAEGTQIQLSAYARGEYILLYWLRDGEKFANNTTNVITVTVDAVHTYTAVFGEAGDELADIVVATRLLDETNVANVGMAYVIKLTINDVLYAHFFAEPQPGYKFKYWLLSDDSATKYTDDSINLPISDIDKMVVFAVFEPIDKSNINLDLDNRE